MRKTAIIWVLVLGAFLLGASIKVALDWKARIYSPASIRYYQEVK